MQQVNALNFENKSLRECIDLLQSLAENFTKISSNFHFSPYFELKMASISENCQTSGLCKTCRGQTHVIRRRPTKLKHTRVLVSAFWSVGTIIDWYGAHLKGMELSNELHIWLDVGPLNYSTCKHLWVLIGIGLNWKPFWIFQKDKISAMSVIFRFSRLFSFQMSPIFD